jgi:hypothetical protein
MELSMRCQSVLALIATFAIAACSQEEKATPATAESLAVAELIDDPTEVLLEETALDVEPLPPRPLPPRPAARRQAEQGPMTQEQMLERAERGFDRADADSDGVVTTVELEAAAETLPNARNWARADHDGDGRLTRDEFRSVVAWRFQRMDTDGDGAVSPNERAAASPSGQRRRAE